MGGAVVLVAVGAATYASLLQRRDFAVAEKSRAQQEAKAEADREDAKRRADEEAARAAMAEKNRAEQEARAEADRKQAETKRRADEETAQRDPALSVTPGSGESFRDRLANGQPCPMCPEMVVAPAGKFTMGSPVSEPQRYDNEEQVNATIARPFAVARFAVTIAEWNACVADGRCGGYNPEDRRWVGPDRRPVINVSWNDARLYIIWLRVKTGKTYRLLSETEREYVTRAGTTTPFWWGSSITPNRANYGGEKDNRYVDGPTTVPVDGFEANPWGLFNVHGNVWEWTEDCWNDSNQGNPGNGSARTTGDCGRRVVRGGSWNSNPQNLRAAFRYWFSTDFRVNNLGFRLARTLTP